ncbi:SDR family NAD(P)-dependent oxidoreductase [Aureivirga sp. CE67]|uniref:SDR family NAD(P)-dependent oxidoreductase n=1 Tax=Aureivirga sp. CE67 TaxID=1788983 RepID=UPI0018C9E439|nr:SDR family oxidoreductase [Aureivirga sp. CE67]
MKNYLIIGGSHGIGKEIANILKKEHNVYVASRTIENTENITHLSLDVEKETINPNLLPETLDGFVYCPGSINLKPFKSLTVDDFQADLNINFLILIENLQIILPKLLKSETASLVFFSSIAATKGMNFHTSISAAKSAIEGFARSFAMEYAPKIRVNIIAPSLTNTPLAEKLLNNDLKIKKSAEMHPLKRIGTVEDIANAAYFLLSENSSWITGQTIHVDGGLSIS